MKKLCSLLLALCALFFFLTACGGAPKIQGKEWILVSASKGKVISYVSSEYVTDVPEGTPTLECALIAKRGALTITDVTNDKTYTGTYSDRDEINPTATDYRIAFGKLKGRALVERGTNINDEEIQTLTLFLGDYIMSFICAK